MGRAVGTIFGLAVMMPGTSVQISTRRAWMPTATSEAVKSEPPRPSVVTRPFPSVAMKPGTMNSSTCGFEFTVLATRA